MTVRSEDAKAELKEAEQKLREAEQKLREAEQKQEQVEQKLMETKQADPANTAEIQRLEQKLQTLNGDVAVLRKAFYSKSASVESKEDVIRRLESQLPATAGTVGGVALSSWRQIPYCLYEDSEWLHAPPVSGLDAFLTYAKSQHKMKEPKLYYVVTNELGEPYDRVKVLDDKEFQGALQLRNQLFLYEGAKGESPRKGKDGLPLYVRTSLRPMLSLDTAGSSSSSPSRRLQQLLADQVKARDRDRCVITGVSNKKELCHACHILAKDEKSRRIPIAFFEKLKRQLSAAEYRMMQPWLSPTESVHLTPCSCPAKLALSHQLCIPFVCVNQLVLSSHFAQYWPL